MSLFGDFSKFLEDRLDEFLQNNPHLELQVLEDELRDQEADTVKLITEFELKEKQLEAKILETAEKIQLWHGRVAKARQAGQTELANGAAEREAALLREGNQLWAQRKAASDRLEQTKTLQAEIRERRRALKAKAAELQAQQASASAAADTSSSASARSSSQADGYTATDDRWDAGNTSYTKAADPLEQAFASWEMDDELDELKRKMKR
ncbi:MAG: TIGR04376 family protein [Coleofasciculaceae cyanobacterium RL_1_1]|nr:TIGR04376 family protein [Coleofasciculaceae cyanobacterium RL_1_1]